MTIRILHNPRCSKSRATLALLREHGVEPDVCLYLDTPPDAAELDRILRALDLQPRELMRTGEAVYAEQRLDDPALDREALIAAMVAHPILIERPIVLKGSRAAVGRPPENVLSLLD
ncbi:arsenate reductase (glutaredoxin) [Oleiagrimonas soli]|uniref:Arsenate reductase n=1 Tax=Oleiagrimonas soli TaxID=1543381 RepID=A0A099CTY0_9GAMM|nr:arsenate reductase (glutaredoxin) [Oleiagrimonas soli]KGI77423.1 arsenate reductase [Oleiagrimonas soli]MBB6183139.1 arsenate reductase [Oleiagrimonas soli]